MKILTPQDIGRRFIMTENDPVISGARSRKKHRPRKYQKVYRLFEEMLLSKLLLLELATAQKNNNKNGSSNGKTGKSIKFLPKRFGIQKTAFQTID